VRLSARSRRRWPQWRPTRWCQSYRTPLKLITVMAAAARCDNVAVTLTLVSTEGAKARQISAVPRCVFVRRTSAHVTPPPVMLVTVVAPGSTLDASTKASSSSLPAVVENAPDAIFGPLAERPAVFVASIVIAVGAAVAVIVTPLTLAPWVTVTVCAAGVKVKPVFDGVIVNVRLATPLTVNAPAASAMVVAPPVRVKSDDHAKHPAALLLRIHLQRRRCSDRRENPVSMV
jgi:hypothetical protein